MGSNSRTSRLKNRDPSRRPTYQARRRQDFLGEGDHCRPLTAGLSTWATVCRTFGAQIRSRLLAVPAPEAKFPAGGFTPPVTANQSHSPPTHIRPPLPGRTGREEVAENLEKSAWANLRLHQTRESIRLKTLKLTSKKYFRPKRPILLTRLRYIYIVP